MLGQKVRRTDEQYPPRFPRCHFDDSLEADQRRADPGRSIPPPDPWATTKEPKACSNEEDVTSALAQAADGPKFASDVLRADFGSFVICVLV